MHIELHGGTLQSFSDRAVGILQKEMNKHPASLAQVDTANLDRVLKGLNVVINAASFSSNDQQKLTALVQQSANSDDEELDAFGRNAWRLRAQLECMTMQQLRHHHYGDGVRAMEN